MNGMPVAVKWRLIETLKALASAVAPSSSSRPLPDTNTRRARGFPLATLDS